MVIPTKNGYNLLHVASALQKAIRRGDVEYAGYFALELFHSNFNEYVWKRLFTVSAEDCADIVTQEIWALYEVFCFLRKKKDHKPNAGRLMISKAVIILCEAIKCRDADHMGNFVYDKKKWISDEIIENYFEAVRSQDDLELPEYTHDMHTNVGKRAGKTREDFFRDELLALFPKKPNSYLDDIIND